MGTCPLITVTPTAATGRPRAFPRLAPAARREHGWTREAVMGKKQVVVAYDFSATSDVALRRALEIAWRAPDHVLHVVHVFGRHGQHHAEMMEHQLHDRVLE